MDDKSSSEYVKLFYLECVAVKSTRFHVGALATISIDIEIANNRSYLYHFWFGIEQVFVNGHLFK